MVMIDNPSPFAPLSEWKTYLKDLKQIEGQDMSKEIARVEKHIANHQSGGLDKALDNYE